MIRTVLIATIGTAIAALGLIVMLVPDSGGKRVGLLTYSDVTGHFQDESGDELALDEEYSTDVVQQLDIEGRAGLFPSAEYREKYGRFSILVFASKPKRQIQRFLKLDNRSRPDFRGIYWIKSDDVWLAFKRYRENVLLAWYDASERGRVDQRWVRLDRVLRELP